jgi:hypothetical protein
LVVDDLSARIERALLELTLALLLQSVILFSGGENNESQSDHREEYQFSHFCGANQLISTLWCSVLGDDDLLEIAGLL